MHISNRELFLQHQAQTTRFPLLLEFERANGIYLYDKNNKPYIDLISGISVSTLGHGNPKVIQAIKSQVDKYMHLMVYGEYVQSPQVQLAQKLTSLLPLKLNTVYFVNSGAEATDGALKLAKRVTKRSQIIAFKHAYHGSTHAALSLNSEEEYKNAFRPLLPDVHFLNNGNFDELDQITSKTSCVIIEIVRGEAGYLPTDETFLKALRKKCDEHCVLLIFDEIQTGIGRTGKLFAFEHSGVIPDILLLGKALGAGMPMGAFVASHNMMMTLAENPILGHITTFGGHPVCCAAALAGLEEITQSTYIEEVAQKEKLFRELLVHPAIKKINGKGLMLALELESFEFNKKVIDGCIADGLITDWFLFASNSMRIAPPLIITNDEIKAACKIIIQNLD
ncbi:MAG: aspartate aminotransferase family protein [Bacteroidia bacterium]|nr:aspartate aminotransferase family protein [Bacteroidia bacterium]MBP9689602.1 aspartate aminotransferase family protein [Bacteroidia bacterium]